MSICENCQCEHDGTYGSGRFCSAKCSRGFSTKAKRKEINEKVSLTLKSKGYKPKNNWNVTVNYKNSNNLNENGHIDSCLIYFTECVGCGKLLSRRYLKTKNIVCSDICYRIFLSKHAHDKKLGGHTSKQKVRYNGVYLQSSYELRLAQSLDKNLVKWIRPQPEWWLDKDLKWHRYYPDFYLPDFDVYLDPKNPYLFIKDQDKIQRVCIQNNIDVIILTEQQLDWNIIKILL